MLRKVTVDTIEHLLLNEKEKLLKKVEEAGEVKDLFELFVLIISAQEEEYGRLFDKPGYLPKAYVEVTRELFRTYLHADFLKNYNSMEGLQALFEESVYLFRQVIMHGLVFVRAQLFLGGTLRETVYSPEEKDFFWPVSAIAHGLGGMSFKTASVPIGDDIEIKTKRVVCDLSLLTSLIMRILDDDNWKIEEEEGSIEPYEGWAFQWDKAYSDLFEVKNDN